MADYNGEPSHQNHLSFTTSEDAYFAAATARPQIHGLRDLGILLNSRRNASLTAIRGVASACIDQDDSGTYDPKESRAKSSTISVRRPKTVTLEDDDNENHEPKSRRYKQVGYSFPMTFVLTSEEGLKYLRSITPGPFDSPADTLNQLSGSLDPCGTSLVGRKVTKPNRLGGTVARVDGLTIDQLTAGHPQRRGCKSCFEAGDDECSLTEHNYDYPCIACDDAGIDCELIVPPELKKVCERCKQKRISCSYKVDGGKGANSCVACAEAATTCCAGPLRTNTNIKKHQDLPSDKTTIPKSPGSIPKRVYISCNQCRNERLRCNLKRDQAGPCRNCTKKDDKCRFVLIRPAIQPSVASMPGHRDRIAGGTKVSARGKATAASPYKPTARGRSIPFSNGKGITRRRPLKKVLKITPNKQRRPVRPVRPSTPPSPQPGRSHGIAHIYIRTSFAHPISFNHIPAPDGSSPCSWCSLPFFGLFGHGERTVEVIPWPRGHGFDEIGTREGTRDRRGHNQLGLERSSMCIPCTFQRVGIMACDEHEMHAMPDVDPRVFQGDEWNAAVAALADGDESRGRLVRDAKFCCVCPALAEYRCATPQMHGLADLEDRGCGLLLCEECRDLLTKIEKQRVFDAQAVNVLDRLVRMVADDKFQYPSGVRADAVFLTRPGELNVRIEQGMGQDVDSPAARESSQEGNEDEIGKDWDWFGGALGDGRRFRKAREKPKKKSEVVVISSDEEA